MRFSRFPALALRADLAFACDRLSRDKAAFFTGFAWSLSPFCRPLFLSIIFGLRLHRRAVDNLAVEV